MGSRAEELLPKGWNVKSPEVSMSEWEGTPLDLVRRCCVVRFLCLLGDASSTMCYEPNHTKVTACGEAQRPRKLEHCESGFRLGGDMVADADARRHCRHTICGNKMMAQMRSCRSIFKGGTG